MPGQNGRGHHLHDTAHRAGKEIQFQKAPAAKDFFDGPAKEVNAKAVEQYVERPGSDVKELKGQKLPDLPMPYPVNGEGKLFGQLDIAVKEQQALKNERDQQYNDKGIGHARRVVGVAHITAIGKGHNEGKIARAKEWFKPQRGKLGAVFSNQ
jgi:hypothetical protein